MSFSGKATYTAGATLPEIAEDVSDIISIVSPFETPLLDHLGDSQKSAISTIHEWLEDSLLPNTDSVNDATIADPANETTFTVANGNRFRIGDQLKLDGKAEVMLVTNVVGDDLTVTRQYGGSPVTTLVNGNVILIIGNAALEGDAAPASRFTNRSRKQNYTQIFTSSVEVSGSQLAAQTIGLADELDFQKQERLRELLRDLENCVINGYPSSTDPQGTSTVRRTMRGVKSSIVTNIFEPDVSPLPSGDGINADLLNEDVLNTALRLIWEQSSGQIDTIVCSGFQKRMINNFISSSQRFADEDRKFASLIDVYESDFGVCRVVMSRWMPPDEILLLDSSRVDVLALASRSFHYKPLATSGDSELGQLIGEYTLEMRNENAHARIKALGTTS